MMKLSPENLEAAVVTVLSGALGVPVATRVPNPRPATFVRVQRAGGALRNMVQEQPTLLVECWAPDDLSAWQLAADAYGHLADTEPLVANGIEMGSRELSSPVNYPDPGTTSARYQFTMQTIVNLEVTS